MLYLLGGQLKLMEEGGELAVVHLLLQEQAADGVELLDAVADECS